MMRATEIVVAILFLAFCGALAASPWLCNTLPEPIGTSAAELDAKDRALAAKADSIAALTVSVDRVTTERDDARLDADAQYGRAERAERGRQTATAEARRLSALADDALAALRRSQRDRDLARTDTISLPAEAYSDTLGADAAALGAGEALRLCTDARRACAVALDSAGAAAEAQALALTHARSLAELESARGDTLARLAAVQARTLDTQRDARALLTDVHAEGQRRARRRGRVEGVALGSTATVLAAILLQSAFGD